MKTVLISGANGFIATAFMKHFSDKYKFVRLSHKKQNGHITLKELKENQGIINSIDVVINLAGANIGAKRWTKKRKAEILNSRIKTTEELVSIFNFALIKPHFISASAIGVYALNHDNDEDTIVNYSTFENFSQQITRVWERAANRYTGGLAITRFGVVLSSKGGAFPQMLRPFLWFMGGTLDEGNQYFPWIGLTDLLNGLDKIIETSQVGLYNLVAPQLIDNHTLSSAIGKVWNRPCWLKMRRSIIGLIFGQMGEELFLNSIKVHPKRLLGEKFSYLYPEIKSCLTAIKSGNL